MTSVVRAVVEVHRLAVAGRELGSLGIWGPGWLGVVGRSRFADVARLAEPTSLWVRTPAPFISSAGPKAATGDRTAALTAYGQALRLSRAAGDRGNEAATLNNIGGVYRGLGEPQRALEYYGQALPIRRETGDRAGEAVTRYNMAMIDRKSTRLNSSHI